MAILYVITNRYSDSTVDNYPPQVMDSDWMKQLSIKTAWSIRPGAIVSGPGTNIRAMWFSSVSEFEDWMNTNRIIDPEFIAAIKEWDSIYNISRSESYYELPSYIPTVTGLFSNFSQ